VDGTLVAASNSTIVRDAANQAVPGFPILSVIVTLLPTIEFGLVSTYPIGQVKTWLAVLMSACCAAEAPQTPLTSEPRIRVFGRVLDAERHQVVRRAAVKIYTSKDQWGEITDSEGRFRFTELAPGDYTLIAHRDGYTNRVHKVERSIPLRRPEGTANRSPSAGCGHG
jgi:hypothetical protein